MSEKYKVVILRDGRPVREVQLEEGDNLVGRWDPDTGAFPEIDLEEDDVEAKVSRKHAAFIKSGNVVSIEDLGSLNGTFLNRTEQLKAKSPRPLKVGDEVMVGGVFLRLDRA